MATITDRVLISSCTLKNTAACNIAVVTYQIVTEYHICRCSVSRVERQREYERSELTEKSEKYVFHSRTSCEYSLSRSLRYGKYTIFIIADRYLLAMLRA